MKTPKPARHIGTMSRPRLATTLLLAPARLLCGGMLRAQSPLPAPPFTLTQSPPIASSQEPPPNVILTVDDSGSMGWDIYGCKTPDYRSAVFGDMDDPDRANNPGLPACPGAAQNPNPSRIANLKSALRSTFGNPSQGSKGIVPDDSIRLAWQAIDDTGSGARPSGLQNNQDVLTPGQPNTLLPFTGTHRSNFEAFVGSLIPDSRVGTALHKMMASVNGYMGTTGLNGPFASVPGTTQQPELSCRRTYHILMTDGAWNSETVTPATIGNQDGVFPQALPDGTAYINNAQTRIYADVWGGAKGTVSDWAFANWARDFQPSIANTVRALKRVDSDETVGGVSMGPYWNPKNNPMTWQGVNQYTIGFGMSASKWAGAPLWNNITDDTYGGDYAALVNGSTAWQDVMATSNARSSELWHMALNGRGKFYPARSAAALDAAFKDILLGIFVDSSRPVSGLAANTANLRTPSLAYVSGYETTQWSGTLKAYPLAVSGTLADAPSWTAESYLDGLQPTALDARKIFTSTETSAVPFTWANLSTTQKGQLAGGDAALGENRVKYLRGERALESSGAMRSRSSRLGDIVNSQPWYTPGKPRSGLNMFAGYRGFANDNAARQPMLYVGANDGMLHGFDATNGQEKLAYVPRGVFANLKDLTLPGYTHRYYVDGDAFTGDAFFGGGDSNWKTVLVGTLGNGGKGYFLLDVSKPAAFGANQVLDDRTDGTDSDIGHMVLSPVTDDVDPALSDQIVQTNDGNWSVIMGNGFNSANAKPVLLVQTLTSSGLTAGPIKVVAGAAADAGAGNGLSSPRVLDLNADGKVDVAFAGDMKGNLWRFDLSAASPSSWSARKLYTAVDGTGNPQPISAAPMWRTHPKGGLMLLLGTGRNFASGDAADTSAQSLYGIWDVSTRFARPGTLQTPVAFTGRSDLVKQEHTTTVAANDTTYYKVTDNEVNYAVKTNTDPSDTTLVADLSGDFSLGWYLDIPLAGHRVVEQLSSFDSKLVKVQTLLPSRGATTTAANACEPSTVVPDESLLYVIDMLSGAPSKSNIFNVAGDIGAIKLPGGGNSLDIKQGKDLLLIEPPATAPGQPARTALKVTGFLGRVPSASYTEY